MRRRQARTTEALGLPKKSSACEKKLSLRLGLGCRRGARAPGRGASRAGRRPSCPPLSHASGACCGRGAGDALREALASACHAEVAKNYAALEKQLL